MHSSCNDRRNLIESRKANLERHDSIVGLDTRNYQISSQLIAVLNFNFNRYEANHDQSAKRVSRGRETESVLITIIIIISSPPTLLDLLLVNTVITSANRSFVLHKQRETAITFAWAEEIVNIIISSTLTARDCSLMLPNCLRLLVSCTWLNGSHPNQQPQQHSGE